MKSQTGRITAVIGALLFIAIIMTLQPETIEREFNGFRAQDMATPLPQNKILTPTPTPTPTLTPQQIFYGTLSDVIENEEITVTVIEYEYLGKFYCTAYCPSECGYNGSNYPIGWQTASGIICHRSDYEDRLYEPTTCAVDPRYHKIGADGALFYVKELDRVFKAEDTGGAVKGENRLDLFYTNYSDVVNFPTGYFEVYSVKYKEVTHNEKED